MSKAHTGDQFTPVQELQVYKDLVKKEMDVMRWHPVNKPKGVYASHLIDWDSWKDKTIDERRRYFNQGPPRYPHVRIFDRTHRPNMAFNQKLGTRPANDFDLRPHPLRLNEEDAEAIVPFRTSANYGHRCCLRGMVLEQTQKDKFRKSLIEGTFYRDNGLHPLQPSYIEKDPLGNM